MNIQFTAYLSTLIFLIFNVFLLLSANELVRKLIACKELDAYG